MSRSTEGLLSSTSTMTLDAAATAYAAQHQGDDDDQIEESQAADDAAPGADTQAGDTEQEQAAETADGPDEDGEDDEGPETGDGEDDAERPAEPDPAALARAPSTMSQAERQLFATLSPEMQDFVIRREREREAGVGKKVEQLNGELRAVETERQKYAENLELMRKHVEGQKTLDDDELQKLRESGDEVGYLVAKEARRDQQDQLRAIDAEHQRIARERYAEAVRKAEQELPAAIPEWSDRATAERELKEVRHFLVSNGLSAEQANAVYAPSTLAVARKAMLYDRLMAGQAQVARKKVNKAPRTLPAGSPPAASRATQKRLSALDKKLSSSQSIDDAVALLLAREKAAKR